MNKKLKANERNPFENDYNKIMNDSNSYAFLGQTPQWNNPKDFIVKFSLIKETPNSITTSNITTSLISK
jgi:hypothetical protein